MTSGGTGAWCSRGRREAMPKPVSHTPPLAGVHQDVGRLDVLVDQPACVHLGDGVGKRDGDAQERRDIQRLAEQPLERLPAGVLEHQGGPDLATDESDRTRRPVGVEVNPQRVFMLDALERPGEGYSPVGATRRTGFTPSQMPRCSVNWPSRNAENT